MYPKKYPLNILINNKLYYLLFFLFYSITFIFSQQRPQFTHYMYNLSVINPAYSNADKGAIEIGAFYQNQWTGVEGSPETGLLFAHGEVSNRIETGFSVLYDRIGNDITTYNINADISYVLPLSKKYKLSMGLKAGVISYSADFSNVSLSSGNNTTDPLFSRNINETGVTLGTGLFLFSNNFYVGVSSPNLIQSEKANLNNTRIEPAHFYAHSGYVFDVHEDLKIKPTILISAINNTPLSVDVTFNAMFNRKFEAGLGYNFSNQLSALFKFQANESLAVGYSYGKIFNELQTFDNGSHGVFVMYSIRQRPITECFYDRFF